VELLGEFLEGERPQFLNRRRGAVHPVPLSLLWPGDRLSKGGEVKW